ncbi:hypothetical protein [Mycoplasma nasistruthionis]|uniref:Uncharacterized protein n=1 Tax=Mycoplasma nasistruthionis TaxID=353852 RepID=A0A5B7XUN4_9MOLU|nr:hypothetical protein [Mycoplasma nasistruthionis]QCZ36601.1 hypothetical protein FG904_01030 [Mycoplasma nasistruthionis]
MYAGVDAKSASASNKSLASFWSAKTFAYLSNASFLASSVVALFNNSANFVWLSSFNSLKSTSLLCRYSAPLYPFSPVNLATNELGNNEYGL